MQVSPISPFEWIVQHIQLIGWPTVVFATYKLVRFLNNIMRRAEAVESNISVIATNHLSHMEKSLASIDETLQKQDLRWESWITAQAVQRRNSEE